MLSLKELKEVKAEHVQESHELLKALRVTIMEEERELLEKQVGRAIQRRELSDFQQTLKEMVERAEKDLREAEGVEAKLKGEVGQLEEALRESRTRERVDGSAPIQAEIDQLNQEYAELSSRRVEAASRIVFANLVKLDLENKKSLANEPFKWILVAMYATPESKYYWPNFCEEALVHDKGQDLRERLGKISALTAQEDQKAKTEWFLKHFEAIRNSPELETVQQDLIHLRTVAELFLKGFNTGKRIARLRHDLEDYGRDHAKLVEENTRLSARLEAFREREELIRLYSRQLGHIRTALSKKLAEYSFAVEGKPVSSGGVLPATGEAAIEHPAQPAEPPGLPSGSAIPHLDLPVSEVNQVHENCTCRLF